LLKAVAILKSFTPDALEMGVTDVAHKVGMPKSTTHRLLATLTQTGLLDRNKETLKYTIGPDLFLLGSLYLKTMDIVKAADPVIKTMNELTNEAVSVAILDRGNVVIVMKEESRYAFRYAVHVGSMFPAYASAMGKALLSELDEEELNNLYPNEKLTPVTEKTIISKTELKKELQEIKEKGISFDPEGSFEELEGIASKIQNASGIKVAAVAITVPVFRLNKEYRERLATLVKMGAGLISYRLGFQISSQHLRDTEEIRSWWQEHY
jgi:DNA-binding IclR family transcriptional regulator